MTHCKKSAGVPRETMRVSLYPGSALFFQSQSSSHIRRHFLKRQTGPLTRRITQTLTIMNNNVRPIAYKVKTTNPKVRRSRDYRAMYWRSDVDVLRATIYSQSRARRKLRHTKWANHEYNILPFLTASSVTKRESPEEPAAGKQSTDKFLIQCLVIPPEQEDLHMEQIVSLWIFLIHYSSVLSYCF